MPIIKTCVNSETARTLTIHGCQGCWQDGRKSSEGRRKFPRDKPYMPKAMFYSGVAEIHTDLYEGNPHISYNILWE